MRLLRLNKEKKPSLPQISDSALCQLKLNNPRENISEHEQNKAPPNPIRTPIDRESSSLLLYSEILEDISLVDIGDFTIAEILGNDVEPETSSKILIDSSPIPKIPLTMAMRTKPSADILNLKKI